MHARKFSCWLSWLVMGAFLFAPAAGAINRASFAPQPPANIPEETVPIALAASENPAQLAHPNSTQASASKMTPPSVRVVNNAPDSQLSEDLSPDGDESYDYVIIVPSAAFVASVDALKVWKEKLGFHVKVVNVNDIYSLYPSGDNAERIWNFLHNRYLPLAWGIRYVLLVGDVDLIPMRYLYPDGDEEDHEAYGSDYYYANLDVDDWDVDNDDRWGEFSQDHLDLHADVLVGRIPIDDTPTVFNIANQIVAYEQATGSWKRQGLLVHGIYDYVSLTSKTDTANLAEMLRDELFTPFGWTTTRLYERDGISPSTYTSDADINQTDYENRCGLDTQGIINVTMHGVVGGGAMASMVWAFDADNDNAWDVGKPLYEDTASEVTQEWRVATHPTNAVVFLCGCETAPVVGDDPNFANSHLRSRYLVSNTRPNLMVKEYLKYGSPVVIGSTAGADYSHLWSKLADKMGQTFNYLFYRNLIEKDLAVGDAFYNAQEEYARQYGLQRGIRVFNYFGDPALLQKGVEERPGGPDTLIKEGSYNALAADYDENGDMYVGVAVNNSGGASSSIHIYRSTNHGQNWSGWTWVDVPAPDSLVWDLSLVVGRLTAGTPYLNVLYSMQDGRVYDTRIDLGNPDNRGTVQVAHLENHAKFLSTARTPGSGLSSMYIYAAWDYEYMSSGNYTATVFRSADNGASWDRVGSWDNLSQPSIDAGPAGAVHLAAVQDNDEAHVVAIRSTDSGDHWSSPIVLTADDGALYHTAPDIAVSTDPAYPAVWIAYDYHFQDPVWSSSIDLRFAYSSDNGVAWQKDRILGADIGQDEWIPDLASLHTAANRWVNLAYNRDTSTATGYDRQVIWRWVSGGLPNYWAPRRVVNDHDSGAPYAIGPVLVYSPGASGSGSGVVYGGADKQNVYFSAPWLATPSPMPVVAERQGSTLSLINTGPAQTPQSSGSVSISNSTSSLPLTWQTLTHIPNASSISGLVRGSDGALYAAAVLNTPDLGTGSGHAGRVYRSDDLGQSWTPTTAFDNAWSTSSLIRTQSNALLVAGMAVDWGAGSSSAANPSIAPTPTGVIYRSTNNGASWSTVYSASNRVVYQLVQASNGSLYAGTGWDGKLLYSQNDGQTWQPLADFGAGAIVQDILQTSAGRLVVALEKPGGGAILSTLDPASGWAYATGLSGVLAVNDLLEANGILFAATRSASGGKIYRSDLTGLSWTNPDTISPAAADITRLYVGAHGQILAGAESEPGVSETVVYRLSNAGLHNWTPYNGWMDMANTVYDLLSTEEGLFAATGYYYGNLFRVLPDNLFWLNLPLVRR